MAELQLFDLAKPLQQAEQIKSARQSNKLAQLLEPMRVQQAQNTVTSGGLSNQRAQGQVTDEQLQRTAAFTQVFNGTLGQDFDAQPDEQKQQLWQQGVGLIKALGADMEGIPMDYSPQGKALVDSLTAQLKGAGALDARTQNFQYLTQGLTPEEVEKARRVQLGIESRAVGSAAQTIAENGSTDSVARSQAVIEGATSGAKEEAKLSQQGQLLPAIRRDIKIAEEEGRARGETLTQLRKTEAAMPGLQEAVGQLRELAPMASSTIGEKLFDQAVKQTGFGATEGATARAKFIAIIDNQVLPLLKETFGAAFTVQEGESLKATMGDPDASPEEKTAQLDAFIAQKFRSLESARREVGAPQQSGQVSTPQQAQQAGWKLATDASGNRAYVGPNGQIVEVR